MGLAVLSGRVGRAQLRPARIASAYLPGPGEPWSISSKVHMKPPPTDGCAAKPDINDSTCPGESEVQSPAAMKPLGSKPGTPALIAWAHACGSLPAPPS